MPASQDAGRDPGQEAPKRKSRPKDQGRDIQKQREQQYQQAFEGQLPNNTFQKLFRNHDQLSPDSQIERGDMSDGPHREYNKLKRHTMDNSIMNQSEGENFDQQRKTIMKKESQMSDRRVPRSGEKLFESDKPMQNMNMTGHAFEKNRRSEAFDLTPHLGLEYNKTTDLLAEDSKSNQGEAQKKGK